VLEEKYQLCLAIMSLQMKASLLQYPKFTGSLTAAAAPVIVPHQIINIFFAIVFEKEAVYLHWELVCNNRTGDQLEQGLLLCRLLGAWLGKSRQVGGYGRSWSTAYWELGWASLGNSAATVNRDRVLFSTSASREAPVDILIYRLLGAGLGKSRQVGGDGRS
jgi:hypothetical protein